MSNFKEKEEAKIASFQTPNLVAQMAALRRNLIAGNKQYSARIEASKASYEKGLPTTNPDPGLDTRVKETRAQWESSNSTEYADRVKEGESNWFTNNVVFDEPEPPKQKYTVSLYNVLCSVDGGGVYEEGSTCVVRAILWDDTHYEFKGWFNEDGGLITSDLIYAFTVTSDVVLYAVANLIIEPHNDETFLGAVCDHGNVTFNPEGSEAVTGVGWYYDATTNVTLTANVVSGYKFVAWTDSQGTYVSTNPSIQVTVTVVEGEFHEVWYYALTEAIRPEKYQISADAVHGIVHGAGFYEYGDTALLRVIPDEGYKFLTWSDGDTSNPRYHYVTADAQFYAVCVKDDPTPPEPDQILIEYSALNGSVQVTGTEPQSAGEGYGYYHYGDTITLTCNPWYGYHFVAWTDGYGQAERNETVKARASYVAICEIDEPAEEKCTVYTAGANCVVSGAGTYEWGTQHTFTCHPDAGCTFYAWYVDGVQQSELSTSLSLIIPSQDYCNIHAYCVPTVPPVTGKARIIALGVNGHTEGSNTYDEGAEYTLEFFPDAEYEFTEWTSETGLHISNSNPFVGTVTTAMLNNTYYYVAQSESTSPERKKYRIYLTSKNGTTTLNPDKVRYDYGETVTATFAEASSDYKFDRFIINGNPVFTNPATIKIFGDTSIDAIGVKKVDPKPGSQDLYLEAVPAAGGKIAFSVDESTEAETTSTVLQIPAGSNVQLYARENEDYDFAHWSDYATVSPSRNFSMPAYPMTIAAYFESEETPKTAHRVRLLCSNGDLYVSIDGATEVCYHDIFDQWLLEGTTIRVNVDAKPGYIFSWWYADRARIAENPRIFKVGHNDITDHAFCAPSYCKVSTPVSPLYTVAQQGKEISRESGLDYGTYVNKELCKITCTPTAGFYFQKWVRVDKSGEVDFSTENPCYFFVDETVTLRPVVHETSVRVITESGKSSSVLLDISHDKRASSARPSLQFSKDEGLNWGYVPTDYPMEFSGTILLRSAYTDNTTAPSWAAFYGTEGEDSRVGDYSRIAFGTLQGCNSLLTLEGNLSTLQNISSDSKNLGYCRNITGACAYIFSNNTYINNITNLVLPPRVTGDSTHNYLSFSCLQSLFENCDHISAWSQGEVPTALPAIKAVNVGSFAFHSMYKGCTSIKQPPYCAVTGIGTQAHWSGIWQSMFEGCTSLLQPMDMGSAYIGDYGCMQMYDGCTSLTYMPALPKAYESVARRYGYKWMFRNCTSLKLVVPLENEYAREECYCGMFENCTSLTETPRIQIISWDDNCSWACSEMFKGCINLEFMYIALGPWKTNTNNWLQNAGTATIARGKTPWFMTPKTCGSTYVTEAWRDNTRDVSHCPSNFLLTCDHFRFIPSDYNTPYTLKIIVPSNSKYSRASKERFRWFFLDTEYSHTFDRDERANWPHWIDINAGSSAELTMRGPVCIINVNESGDGGPWKYGEPVQQFEVQQNTNMTFEVAGATWWLTKMATSDSEAVLRNMLSYNPDSPGVPNIVEAKHLYLPNTGETWMYGYMRFMKGQSNLKSYPYVAPGVPFAYGKFEEAFQGCSSVEMFTSPYFGALGTSIPERCFFYTFADNTKLKYAPVMNCNSIGVRACAGMFYNCSSLQAAPYSVTSITVGEEGCRHMFAGCSSLVHNGFYVSSVAKNAYYGLYEGCTSLGSDGSFCTLVENVTSIPDGCFRNMFKGCTSMQYPMVFSSITSVGVSGLESCYENCANVTGCSSIGSDTLASIKLSTNSLKAMYKNSGLKSGYSLPPIDVVTGGNLNSALESCYENCKSFDFAPRIPHIIAPHGVSNQIFKRMYAGCTTLKSTPTMYCRLMDENAFIEIFDGCSALYAVHTQGLIVDDASISNWLRGVGAEGVLYCPYGSQIDDEAYQPAGWDIIDNESPKVETLKFTCNAGSPSTSHTFVAKFNTTTHKRETELMRSATMYAFVDAADATNIVYAATLNVVVGSTIWKVDGVEWSAYATCVEGSSTFTDAQFAATASSTQEYYTLNYNHTEVVTIEGDPNKYYPVNRGSSADCYVTTPLPAAGGKVYNINGTTVTEYATIDFVTDTQ